MQQFSSFPLLGPAPSNSGQAIKSIESGANGIDLATSKATHGGQGKGFNLVFSSVSTPEDSGAGLVQPLSWDQFTQQYPQLMEQLGSDFDFSQFFSQFQMEGQDFTQIMSPDGELLPLDLSQEGISGALQDMTAWFKGMGIELTIDDSGQIVPLAMDDVSIDAEGISEALDNIAETITQLFSALKQEQSEDGADVAVRSTGHDAALLSSANGKALGLNAQSAIDPLSEHAKQQSASPVAQMVRAVATENAQANQGQAANSGAANSNGAAQGLMDQGMQQGFSQQGQSQGESSSRFRQAMEASLDGGAEKVIDELVGPKAGDTAQTKFAELQAKIPGGALKQYSTGVGVPVGDPGWEDQMSQKIIWMAGRSIQSAEIHLNPAELGPVEVKISMQNEQAAITINAQHASVRELLESNVHRLREMMSSNGVDLGDVDVGGGEQQGTGFAEEAEEHAKGAGFASAEEEGVEVDGQLEESTVSEVQTGVGMVDYYA